jgi:hypothetical protein
MRNLLGMAIEAELPATLLFEHPSVSALVEHLQAEYLSAPVDARGPEPIVEATPETEDVDELASALAARLDRLGQR